MDELQTQLRAINTDLNVEILGVNLAGLDAFNAQITAGRTLPWLQDTTDQDVWNKWGVTWRDLRILDAQNQLYAVYNLTQHDLTDSANRDELKQLLMQAAQAADTDQDGLMDVWESTYFKDLSATPTGDPDGDRLSNALEFAFGSDPTLPNLQNPSVLFIRPEQPLSFSFRRRLGSFLSYVVETSTDLQTWTPALPSFVTVPAARNLFDGTGMGEVVCRPGKLGLNDAQRFVRVRAVPRQAPLPTSP